IFGPLLAGARLILTEPGEHFNIAQLVSLFIEHQITVLDVVPSLLRVLLDDPQFLACRSIRRVTSGGGAPSFELQQLFFSRMQAELHNVYGPTEATIGATAWACRREYVSGVVPIGRPIANTTVYLLDHHLNPVAVGVVGEIYIGGEGVARGYLNR